MHLEDKINNPDPVVGLGYESAVGWVILLDKWLEHNNFLGNGHN